MRTSFSWNTKYLCYLLIALSWLLTFLWSKETCLSTDNLLPMLMPRRFSEVTWLQSILTVYWSFISEFTFTMMHMVQVYRFRQETPDFWAYLPTSQFQRKSPNFLKKNFNYLVFSVCQHFPTLLHLYILLGENTANYMHFSIQLNIERG